MFQYKNYRLFYHNLDMLRLSIFTIASSGNRVQGGRLYFKSTILDLKSSNTRI